MKKTLLTILTLSLIGGKCYKEDVKWWYHLHEVPNSKPDTICVVDYNADGEIDLRDALFIGEDNNKNGLLDVVHIFKFRKFFMYKGGPDHYINFKVAPQPDETWYDFDNDGLYDSRIYNNNPFSIPEQKQLPKPKDLLPRIKKAESTKIDGTLIK